MSNYIYTEYLLTWDGEYEDIATAELIKLFIALNKYNENDDVKDNLPFAGVTEDGLPTAMFWDNPEQDMTMLSEEFPDVRFTLHTRIHKSYQGGNMCPMV